MSLHSIRISLLALASAIILAACGGNSSSIPAPPEGGIVATAGDSQITISWKERPGVEDWLFAAPNTPNLSLNSWLATAGSTSKLKITSPYVVTGLSNGTPYSFFITSRISNGPGSEATPTVTATPRLAGIDWTSGVNLNTGTQTGLSFGSYVDTASNTFKYVYLAVGNGGRMLRASTIDAWTAITPVVSTNLNGSTFGFAKFIAAGDAGQVIYSTDTQTWVKATSITAQNLNAISNNGIIAIAVGNNGTIITSKDAITWTAATTVPTSAHLYGVAYTTADTWIAVGAGGALLTSTDGATWKAQSSNTTADLKAVGALASYVNNTATYTFVVVGSNGTILSSSDAITWVTRSSSTTANLNDLSSLNQFTAVGANGSILTSQDGVTWTSKNSNTTAELKTVLRSENQYIAVNSSGGIIYSK